MGETNIPWVVTHDHLDNEQVIVTGPSGARDRPVADYKYKFRMYDDDGVLTYSGASLERDNFDPLDDYGMPNAGCTRIDYLQPNGGWETI